MADEHLRELERQAAGGDEHALGRLEVSANRVGSSHPVVEATRAAAVLSVLQRYLEWLSDYSRLHAPCCMGPVSWTPTHVDPYTFGAARGARCANRCLTRCRNALVRLTWRMEHHPLQGLNPEHSPRLPDGAPMVNVKGLQAMIDIGHNHGRVLTVSAATLVGLSNDIVGVFHGVVGEEVEHEAELSRDLGRY